MNEKKDPESIELKFILELLNSNKFLDAKKEIDKKIIKFPNSSILYNILGAILAGQNQLEEAVKNYKKSIKINPEYAAVYNNLGIALQKLNKTTEAIENYRKAISLKNNFSEALNNLGNAILNRNKPKDALAYFKQALEIKSDYADAYYNIGIAYDKLGKRKEALDNFLKAIKIKPKYAEVYTNIGLLFLDKIEYEKSLENFEKSIELKPDYEKAYNNLGNLFNSIGRFDEATEKYHKAIKIKSDYALAYSNLLFNLNYKTNFDPNIYLSEAKKFSLNCKPDKKINFNFIYEKKPKKLKIGFISADFGNHPGGYFTLSTLRELRKKDLELVAYSTFDRNDEFVHHFRTLFSKWNSIEGMGDEEVAQQIVNDGIHILLDLQGHSSKNRLPIFFYKAAPIQATWLGQGSSGITEIDYFIGSSHITPKKEEKDYVEKIIRLPEISQCFTPPDFNLKIDSLPALKNNFITFGCLNKFSKMNDEVIALWSKILLSIPKSKLLLKSREFKNKEVIKSNLEKFKKHNIHEDRLIIMGHSKTRKEVLETFNKIDIALDPFPFQGNTSTCEAVWMGVPVITLKGNRYLFHFGESINSNLNMNSWIAYNKDDYVKKAIKFSSDLNKLKEIRINLREKASRSPVFDAERFSRYFCEMLWSMWDKLKK